MAVLKTVNKSNKYHDDNAREAVITYILNPQKAKYIGGSHVDMKHPAQDMTQTAKDFHKDHGIRIYHIIISFSDQDAVSPSMAYMEAEEMSKRIGLLHENIYAVHESKNKPPHIHIAFNAVSHINGYKYNAKEDRLWLYGIVEDAMDNLDIPSFQKVRNNG